MSSIYPNLTATTSPKDEGVTNEGFNPDLENDGRIEQDSAPNDGDIENDLADKISLSKKISSELSSMRRSIRRGSTRSSKHKKNSEKLSDDGEEAASSEPTPKSHIYGDIMPGSLTEGSKKGYEEPEKTPPVDRLKAPPSSFHKKYVRPFIYKYNVPPSEPTTWEKLKYFMSCPPHGNLETAVCCLVVLFFFWASLVYIIFGQALPGGNIFSILILAVVGQVVSMILGLVQIPPLLGMLLTGIVFKSVPVINVVGLSVDDEWSSTLKSCALVTILIRAGLGLDPVALKKLSFVVLRLSCTPCLTEALVDAVVSHYLLGFPWKWAFIQGFVIAAISPAVVVPCLLNLSSRGYGNRKGIPTLLIAAASIDDVVTITGFGIAVGLTFSSGSAVWQAFKGPIAALMGIAYGLVIGVILWYIPSKNNPNCNNFRSILILLAGLLVIFGSKGIDYSGAGAIGCLITTFVAAIGHRSRPPTVESGMPPKIFFNHLWDVLAPIIFSLIGAEINVTELDPNTILWGVITIIIGLTCRFVIASTVVMGAGFTLKERLFIAIAWIPKATVQAAIGGIALDYARKANSNPDIVTEHEIMGQKILTVAVLAILIAAPIGAAATMISGPILLKDSLDPPNSDEENPSQKQITEKQSPEKQASGTDEKKRPLPE